MSALPTPANVCESCSSKDVTTEPVRRMYLDPDAPGDIEAATVDDDVEEWCASCMANYPHLRQPRSG